MLKFSPANSKIKELSKVRALAKYLKNGRKVYSFDLLSGFSCPFAHNCLSKVRVDVDGRKHVEDGHHTLFRCFSASQEVLLPGVYRRRKSNFDTLRGKTFEEMYGALRFALPFDAGIIRLHVGGDFFSYDYFYAWCELARNRPDILFYTYTKSLPYWIRNLDQIPANLVLTASYGGRRDSLIKEYGLRSATVVYSEQEAKRLGLAIDHDDSHSANPKAKSFALLVHGTQPVGSEASKALSTLKKNNIYGYGRAAQKRLTSKTNKREQSAV